MSINWKIVALEEAVEICDSMRKPINSKERQNRIAGKEKSALFPYYGATGQVGYIDDYITDGEYVLVGEDGAPFLDSFAKKAYIINGKTWVNNHAHILKSKGSNKFLCYYLNHFNYKSYVSGTTRLKLTQAQLRKIPVPIPSLEEQTRIVTRIEELFSELDKAVETLNKTKEQLAVYRQAVLNNCLGSGKLLTIKECIISMGQGWSPKCERVQVISDDEWAVITTTAIQPFGFVYTENKKLPNQMEPRLKHELDVGDVLITRAGPRSRCGICCMVKKTKKKLLNCDKVYRIKVNYDLLLPEYLEAVLNTPQFLKELEFCKTGGSDSGVNLTQERFLSIKIPVPDIDNQKLILNKIQSQISVCDSIEKTVDSALQQAEAMRQSILKKAFEGGL